MFVIRQKQLQELAEERQEFSADLLAMRIRSDFPEQAEELGQPRVVGEVRYGLKKALDYGFRSEEDATIYVYVMFAFGRDFDQNPAFSWASEILQRPQDDATRAGQLRDAAAENEFLGLGLGKAKAV
jgi:hypothetical protein